MKILKYLLVLIITGIGILGLGGCNNGSSGNDDTNSSSELQQNEFETIWFSDEDGDGYGNPEKPIQSEFRPYRAVMNDTDCNDADATIHPFADDIAYDGIDQDCNGIDSTVPGIIKGSFFISNEEDVEYLSHYASVEGSLYISSESLTSLNLLSRLTHVGGNLEIFDNPNLTDLQGLEGLESVGGFLRIARNNLLENLNSLNSLTNLSTHFFIIENPSLTNLSGLKKITAINGSLHIFQNDALLNLEGLENIKSISDGDLKIRSNQKLTDLKGLEGMTSVNGNIIISSNNAIIDLKGLNKVESVFGNLDIQNNDQMTELQLDSLCYVEGKVRLSNKKLFSGVVTKLKNQIESQCGNNSLFNYCANGIQDEGEEGVDCGGECPAECTDCLSISDPDFGNNFLYAPFYSFNNESVQQAADEAVKKFAEHYNINEDTVYDSPDLCMEAVAWYVHRYMRYMYDTGFWGTFQSAKYTVGKSGERIGCTNKRGCAEKVKCNEIPIEPNGLNNEKVKYCGDCEDHAFLRASLLRHLGISEECIMVASAYSPFVIGEIIL